MKISIITLGTRGDLQPFIALGLGLKNNGYDVLIISSKNEEVFTKSFGLKYHPLNVDIQKLMEGDDIQQMTKADNPVKFITSHLKSSNNLKQKMLDVQEEIWQACQDTELIIYHPGMSNAYFMAKKLNIPSIMASPFPVTSTKNYPAILFYNGPRLGKIYNLLTHFVFGKVFWALSKSTIKSFWKKRKVFSDIKSLNPLELQTKSGMPVIYGYSEQIFQRPKEWLKNIYVTGYWIVKNEPAWKEPPELVNFIADGKPPVYIGFGSIKDIVKFKETFEIILEALKISKQRGVIALGWNNLDWTESLPENVFLLDSAPHSWLFPKMSVVVHHGGAGTTAAGLNAGKPTVVIPHFADQPAWGKRVYELGVGSKPIYKKKLTAKNLSDAIISCLDKNVINRAEELGKKIRTEEGVNNAVNIIDNFMKNKKDSHYESL